MIYNTTEYILEVWEIDCIDFEKDLLEVGPGQMLPFWPQFGAKQVVAKVIFTLLFQCFYDFALYHTTSLRSF